MRERIEEYFNQTTLLRTEKFNVIIKILGFDWFLGR